MSEHPATMPGEHEAHPVRTAPRWGMSPLDCKTHAIDEDPGHPYGVYLARCGHRLLKGTTLHDEAPGWICRSCLRWNEQPHPQREDGREERAATRVTDQPRTPAPVQVPVQGTPTHDGTAPTLLVIHETGGTWMIHSTHHADLAAAATETRRRRHTLRQLITLAGDAPTLTGQQLRDRLRTLATDAAEPCRVTPG
ncbi:MAG: hypothetical protein ACRDRQ_25100 [Pseudonocardiaceae bacterium]